MMMFFFTITPASINAVTMRVDQFHVEQVRLLIASTGADYKLWVLRISRIEEHESDAEDLTQCI